MIDSTTPRTRMTRDICAGSASSGSPLAPPKAPPCVLHPLFFTRPPAHAGPPHGSDRGISHLSRLLGPVAMQLRLRAGGLDQLVGRPLLHDAPVVEHHD